MAAFDTDFLTRVVNVNWTGGLAVEFTERPDYLTLTHALSMNKAVISFWFRVPTEAATAARATAANEFWDYRVFLGVIPLITWGPQQTTPASVIVTHDTGAMHAESDLIITLETISTHTSPVQQSCIGVRVGSTLSPWNPPVLEVHIQTDVHASGTGLAQIQTAFTGDFIGYNTAQGPHNGRPMYANVKYTIADVSYTLTDALEYLGNSDANSSGSGAGHPEVSLDKWHHLLISWDLLSHSNMDGASKMWCAIDDENLEGYDLPAMCDPGAGMGPNDHMTWTTFNWKGDDSASSSVSLGSNNVPSDPFRLPGPPSAQYTINEAGGVGTLQPIETVELAELQIFSGVTLDTSKETNRRAFIDFVRDADGNPIEDADGKRTLKPVNPKQAEDLLGKRPDILLHGSAKWQEGKNTGSIGIDTDGDAIPSGQFTPTGVITKYTPDPSITGA